jgi:hypothetical protein
MAKSSKGKTAAKRTARAAAKGAGKPKNKPDKDGNEFQDDSEERAAAAERAALEKEEGDDTREDDMRRANSIDPEKWLKHYNELDKAQRALDVETDTAATARSKLQEKKKKAKAAGVDPDVLKEVRKLMQLPDDELQDRIEKINMMLVILKRAIAVRHIAPEVTLYTQQLGFDLEGKSIATQVEDNAATAEKLKAEGGNIRVTEVQIGAARARGIKAANAGESAEKNPYDAGHPLRDVWEDARQKQTAAIAAKNFGATGGGDTQH